MRLCDEGGFAVCRLDLRGTGSSDGIATDEYPPSEHDDLAEVIAWLAAQEWSNGRVGMFGTSYSGFNSLQVACRAAAGARGDRAPIYATDDRYTDDVHYMGGALKAARPRRLRALHGRRERAAAGAGRVRRRLARASGARRVDGAEPWLLRWLEEQVDGPYWRHGSVRPGLRAASTCADDDRRRLGRRLPQQHLPHASSALQLPEASCCSGRGATWLDRDRRCPGRTSTSCRS